MFKILLISYCIFLSGCAVGPMVSHESARTTGKSNHELIGGYGQAGYVIKWNYGLAKNLDLGLQSESLSHGVRLKYAFLNNSKGWSFASAAGTGLSFGGNHYYADAIASYLVNSWEPYSTLRLVHARNGSFESRDKESGQINFKIDKSEYNYGQLILGTRYWFSEHWLLSVEASSFFGASDGLKMGQNAIVGAAFGYRF